MKALVVDDHDSIRLILEKLLTQLGYLVDCAENGRDAVLKFVQAAEEGQPYSFVSMDYEMPVMNGYHAVQMIRAYETTHYPHDNRALVCFVSGYEKCCCPERHSGQTNCPTSFLTKPIDFDRFRSLAVAKYSGLHSSLPPCTAPCCMLGSGQPGCGER